MREGYLLDLVQSDFGTYDLTLRAPDGYRPRTAAMLTSKAVIRDRGAAASSMPFAVATARGLISDETLSPAWIDYQTIGTVRGIRDGLWTIASVGIPSEAHMPFDPVLLAAPQDGTIIDAATRTTDFYKIGDLAGVQHAIDTGLPVVIGVAIHADWPAGGEPGHVPLPLVTDPPVGGEAFCVVGYADATDVDGSSGWLVMMGSQGKAVGNRGYFYLPYEYLTDVDVAWWEAWTFAQEETGDEG